MIEFKKHIEFYNLYWHQHFSKIVPENEWGNKKKAEEYLYTFWLTEYEYNNVWLPIQNEIFIKGKNLPDLIYLFGFEMIFMNGGCLFIEEDFKQLQQVMRKMGEEYFVIIQNVQGDRYTKDEPVFRMKFPVNITWEELMSGNYISAVLFEMSLNEYFVFGSSGKWGKYSANDYEYPLDIIGFKPEYSTIFREQFKQSEEEQVKIKQWLPPKYKELIK